MTPAHIAALFGDVSLLKSSGSQALSAPDAQGDTPAHYAVRAGHAWVLQCLSEAGADVKSKNKDNKSPEDLIFHIRELDDKEKLWLASALEGNLSEKESIKAQEYRIKNDRPRNIPAEIQDLVEQPEWYLRLRKFHYGTVDWDDLKEVKFKPPPPEESLAKRDLPRSDFTLLQAIKRPSISHLPCALIFPGIGSQYVGIMKDAMDYPPIKGLLDKADEVLGWDVRQLAIEGPEDRQSQPLYCQPLLFVACMAALELFKSKHQEEFNRLQCVAGLSIGEYSALVAADVMDFDLGLRLVKIRAEALDNAVNASPQAMCSVAGLSREIVESLCFEAELSTQEGESAICRVTNSLFPSGFTVGGTRGAVMKFLELAKEARALQTRQMKGGGAYHTALMKSADEKLGKALEDALPHMRPPRCGIYLNRNGKKVSQGADPRCFILYLREQLTHEVLWETSVKNMITDGVQDFFEVGPLKQLRAMMKRVDQEAFQHTMNITI
jgi:[acyl-carrier-protein] S-malonyltransferase